VFAEIAT